MEESKSNSYDNSSAGELETLRRQQSVENVFQKRREIYQGFNKVDFVALQRCYLCESTKIEPGFDKEGFGFFQCKKCEFLFQNPRLRKEKYYRLYCESEFTEIGSITRLLMEFDLSRSIRAQNLHFVKIGN